MRHSSFNRPRCDLLRIALAALACMAGAPLAFAQVDDPGLAQLQQQLQPAPGAQLQAPVLAPLDAAPSQPQPVVQQVQSAPQALPATQPQSLVTQPPPATEPQQVQAPAPVEVAQQVAAPAPAIQQPQARQPQPAVVRRRSDVGASTEAWLELQRSNRAAAPEAHPFEGAAASYAYQRYLQSFSTPIPTWFTPVQRSSGGGGSSFGGGDSASQ
ncbi:DUF3613 domain-containing protein [Burkholderia gladioli]|uniref:DUF3613 domain-containing protein n=1 Tax=Burkholderia gladioli TaxID=28095 RepID=UPI001641F27C|nr:DUF3613 domain-containing protein [Burkholderia gladioli]